MTPKWIHSNAVITGPHALYPQYFAILPTTGVSFQRALTTQFIAPNILKYTDNVTVTVTVAVDATYASNSDDHDLIIGVNDGMSFIGFQACEKASSPCNHIEGDSNNTDVLQNFNRIIGPIIKSQRYSSEIKIQIRPAEQWGSCHTEHDEGYTNIANYQRSLDPSKGLHLELYYENASEQYRIKYIVVNVDID